MTTSRTLVQSSLGFLLLFALYTATSTAVLAHDSALQSALRDEIRSALISDSRSASLSDEEISAMVDALAEQAESQDAVSDFVLPPPSQTASEVAPTFSYSLITPWGQPISSAMLYSIILTCLACAALLLWWLLHLHKRGHAEEVPTR